MVRTDYPLHDWVYQQRKGQGQHEGWDSNETFESVNALVREVMAWPEIPPTGRLLEIGCGAANHLLGLAPRFELAGIDISPTAIAWGTEHAIAANVSVDLRQGDVRQLPWDDEAFDVVRDGHLLHCIIGEDRATVLGEARRVLQPGGVLVVFTMCGDKGLPEDQWDPATRLCMREGVATRYVGLREDIETEVEAAGFEAARSEVFVDEDGTDELVMVARKPE
ncbi:MAG TPA: methyltransferase domain-containing protein [Acidimicrobiales bacterium]|nr:methyltransferase domain-containing protein [Acidimicrobiales bacterium]